MDNTTPDTTTPPNLRWFDMAYAMGARLEEKSSGGLGTTFTLRLHYRFVSWRFVSLPSLSLTEAKLNEQARVLLELIFKA